MKQSYSAHENELDPQRKLLFCPQAKRAGLRPSTHHNTKQWKTLMLNERRHEVSLNKAKSQQQSLAPHQHYSNTKTWEKVGTSVQQIENGVGQIWTGLVLVIKLSSGSLPERKKERNLETGHIQVVPVVLLWNVSCANQSLASPATWSLYHCVISTFICGWDEDVQRTMTEESKVASTIILQLFHRHKMSHLVRSEESCQSCSICTTFIPGTYSSA